MSRSVHPAPRAEPIQARLARLETTLEDLARENRLLHDHLAELAEHLGNGQGEASVTAKATAYRSRIEPDTRNLKDILRSLLRRLRELWRVTDPTLIGPMHRHLETGPRRALPGLAVVFLTAESDPISHDLLGAMGRQTAAVHEWIFWHPTSGTFRVTRNDGTLIRQGQATRAEDLWRGTEAAYLLTAGDDFVHLEPTAVELAWLSLATEELAFVELPPMRGRAAAGLLIEKELWRSGGTPDVRKLAKRLKSHERRVLGKVLPHPGGGDRAWLSRPPELRGWRQTGPYVIGDPSRGGILRHPLRELDSGASSRAQELAWMVLIDAPLAGGLERFVAELLRQLPATLGNPLVVTLRPSDALQAERLAALTRATPRVYGLADFLPVELHPSILEGWIRHHAIATVIHLQSSESTSAPYLEDLRQLFPNMAWHKIPHRVSGERAADWTRRLWTSCAAGKEYTLDDGTLRQALRQRLGVPRGALLVSQIGDLITSRRPEDFAALAHRLREDDRFFFLLRGRGPLAGTVEDLATFFALENFHRLDDIPVDAVLAASDIVCSTAEEEFWPFVLGDAMARQRPIVACAPGLGELLRQSSAGIAVTGIGDLDGFAEALEALTDTEARRQKGSAGSRFVLSCGLEDGLLAALGIGPHESRGRG